MAKKKSNRMDISIRVRRRDGRPMKRSEAEAVMAHVRRNAGRAPRAYIVTGVEWSRPGKKKGSGTAAELEGGGLAAVLNAVAGDPDAWQLRLGSVKEDAR